MKAASATVDEERHKSGVGSRDFAEAVADRHELEIERGLSARSVGGMSVSEPKPVPRKPPSLGRWAFGLGAAALLAAAWWGRDLPLREVVESGMRWIRTAGPGWYFATMAVVPLPLAWFTVPAGEAFAGQMTLPGVIAAALAAVAAQLTLSYAAARYGLRPLVERLIRRSGRTVPRVTSVNAWSVALVVRLTPGPPLILGSCILAVAETPFRLYLLVSWLVALPWVVGGVMLGRGAFAGNFAAFVTGAGVLVVATFAVRWARRRVAGHPAA